MATTSQIRDALANLSTAEIDDSGLIDGLRVAVAEEDIGPLFQQIRTRGFEADSKRLGDTLVSHIYAEEYPLPEVGDKMRDPESQYGDPVVEVVEVLPNSEAATYYFETDTGSRSVAWANPQHPADAPVVKAKYRDHGRTYSFPSTRLEPVDS